MIFLKKIWLLVKNHSVRKGGVGLSEEKSKYSVHLPMHEYYIFIKRKKSKKNDKDFYKALLKTLESGDIS